MLFGTEGNEGSEARGRCGARANADIPGHGFTRTRACGPPRCIRLLLLSGTAVGGSSVFLCSRQCRQPSPEASLFWAFGDEPTRWSTLAATQKFRDSLAGRKRVIALVPVLHEELPAFGVTDVRDRLLRGGLPPALLVGERNLEFYGEWLDSYFARDVQELFRLEKRAGFLRVLELLFRQSGGMLDVTKIAAASQISRPTVTNWLEVYQATQVIHLVRPFSGGGRREIVAPPRVFGFDTGFAAYARGWDTLRAEDCGLLWEHLVLDTLLAAGVAQLHFWRDKQQREVDFVLPRGRDRVDAIECKWKSDAFETRNLAAFRELYPKGRNFVVSPLNGPGYSRVMTGFPVEFVTPAELRVAVALK